MSLRHQALECNARRFIVACTLGLALVLFYYAPARWWANDSAFLHAPGPFLPVHTRARPVDSQRRALDQLFGDRTPLDPRDASSVSWTPAAPWFAGRNLSSLFPKCAPPDPEECDDWYAPSTTTTVQQALWASQNPSDCEGARFLVLDQSYPSGLGSSVHIHMDMLALAISDNRVLIASEDLTWHYAAPELCDQALKFNSSSGPPAHLATRRPPGRYLDCYFMPTTRCSLPSKWREVATPMQSMNSTDKIVHMAAHYDLRFAGFTAHNLTVRSAAPGLAQHAAKPKHWWNAQLAKFVLRPSDYTLHQLVWTLQQNAFYRTQGALPHPLAAIFIRAGDKFKEAPPKSVDEHFAQLAPVAAGLGIKDVYLGSDSWDRIEEALDKYSANYTIHFIDWHRPAGGLTYADVLASRRSWRMAELVRLALTDMLITAQADVHVGTLSSSWASLADELRRANGKARVPYLSPEAPGR